MGSLRNSLDASMSNHLLRLVTTLVLSIALGACGGDKKGEDSADVSSSDAAVTDAGDASGTDADERPDADSGITDVIVDASGDGGPDVGPDAEQDVVDTGSDIRDVEEDAGPVTLNSCGGREELRRNGVPAQPGDACGCTGLVVCDGANELVCIGDSPRNGCGGCGPLAGVPGSACGECGDGEWTCNDDGVVTCEGGANRNLCGGCSELPGLPGFVCDSADGIGVWTCEGPEELLCLGDGRNACGGPSLLDAFPGVPCGQCLGGVQICDGRDDTFCARGDRRINACGGCGALPALPGDACGCGGTWQCDDDNPDQLNCVGSVFNQCGGCADLEAEPGLDCGEAGVWICASPDRVACLEGAGDVNLCGGEVPLARNPGEPCGPCGNGRIGCVNPDTAVCLGDGPSNSCPGCGSVDGEDGGSCARGAVFVCEDDGDLTCTLDGNACGGVWTLDNEPGTRCGACDLGIYACDGLDATVCIGVPDEIPVFYRDGDGDGAGAGEALIFDDCDSLPDDVVPNAGDCDDADDAIFPGAPEICDGEDNDCDDLVDNAAAADASCVLANAYSECVVGRCEIIDCDEGFGDCDGRRDNGCEQSLDTTTHCGSCDNACTIADGTGDCATGTCEVGSCFDGFDDCDERADTGCETALNTTNDCGGCGIRCTVPNGDGTCETGTCEVLSCDPGFEDCDLDPLNGCEQSLDGLDTCGGCAGVCRYDNAIGSCESGVCEFVQCEEGFANCDGFLANGCETSIDTLTDCGGCGIPCSAPNAVTDCSTGVCAVVACELGFDNCDTADATGCETALDSLTDCGGCGVPCESPNSTMSCGTGTCEFVECVEGFEDCDTLPSTGCETDTLLEDNCGACGIVCAVGEVCDGTRCVPESVVDIAADLAHTCALLDSDRVLCWGRNDKLQTGQTGTVTEPSEVVGTPEGIVEIEAGFTFTCVRTDVGEVWCWGNHDYTRTGATSDHSDPRQVPGITGALELEVGRRHACVLLPDDSVSCWGENTQGQLGNGSTSGSSAGPSSVSGLADISSLHASYNRTCAILTNGTVRCWGGCVSNTCGTGASTRQSLPIEVPGVIGARDLIMGDRFTCAKIAGDAMSCWGEGSGLSWGLGATPQIIAPRIDRMWGDNNALCYDVAGEITCRGLNSDGQMGDGTSSNSYRSSIPRRLDNRAPLQTVRDFAFGLEHSCALLDDGVFCAGTTEAAQLADQQINFFVNRVGYTPIAGLADSNTEVFACNNNRDDDGDGLVDCADDDCSRDLGSAVGPALAVVTEGLTSSNLFSTCYNSGRDPEYAFRWTAPTSGLYAFSMAGSNFEGGISVRQGGCGGFERGCNANPGLGESEVFVSVDAGEELFILVEGSATGRSSRAVVSIFDTSCSAEQLDCDGDPLNACEVNSASDLDHCGGCGLSCGAGELCVEGACETERAVSVDAHRLHACAVMESGRLRCWGSNSNGRMGLSDTSVYSTATLVPGIYDAVEVVVGYSTTCYRSATGDVFCAGAGNDGELGGAVSSDSAGFQPVRLSVPSTALFSLDRGFCSVDPDGQLWCWGRNNNGQLGVGDKTNRIVPTLVPTVENVVDVAGTESHSCAVVADGRVYCWGQNADYQLGDGTVIERLRPIEVPGITDAVAVATSPAPRASVCALRESGIVVCWGDVSGRSTPIESGLFVVPELAGVTTLDTGDTAYCGLDADGALLCYGSVSEGAAGVGVTSGIVTGLSGIDGLGTRLTGFTQAAIGLYVSCAVDDEGRVWCSSTNGFMQSGNGQLSPAPATTVFAQVVGIGTPTTEVGACGDGSDNDGDGAIDGEDSDCADDIGSILGYGVWTSYMPTSDGNFANGSCDAYTGRETVARWTAPATGSYLFTTAGTPALPGAASEVLLYVRDGAFGGPELGCALDGGSLGTPEVTLDLVAGQTVYVFIDALSQEEFTSTSLTVLPTACDAEHLDCNGDPFDGCEVFASSDRFNCGACGTVCYGTERCDAGVCVADPVVDVFPASIRGCATTESGAMWCWGNNTSSTGASGWLPSTANGVPQRVDSAPDVFVQMEGGQASWVALDTGGTAWTWGSAFHSQLAHGSGQDAFGPTPVRFDGTFIDVCMGQSHACFVGSDNRAYCVGSGSNGRLGTGDLFGRAALTPIEVGAPVMGVGCGDAHTCALTTTGDVRCWGSGSIGQLGDGARSQRLSPVAVTGLSDVVELIVSEDSSYAMTASGELFAWGDYNNENSPTSIAAGVDEFDAGGTHVCVRSGGTVECAGSSTNGRLGREGSGASEPFTPVTRHDTGAPITDAIGVSADFDSTFVQTADGSWWAAGSDDSGDLGLGHLIRFVRFSMVGATTFGTSPVEYGRCDDGVDNDGDSNMDCDDPDCSYDLGSLTGTSILALNRLIGTGSFHAPSCTTESTVGYEVAVRWTAPVTSTFEVSATGDGRPVISVYEGCYGSELTCSVDVNTTVTTFEATAGATYTIVVEMPGLVSNSGTLSINPI